MRFEETSEVLHPASAVLEILIDAMERITPFLPNVEGIETQSRSLLEDGRIRIVRRWQGRSEAVPRGLRPFLSEDVTAWIDTAVWSPDEHKVEWTQASCATGVDALYECSGVNYFEPDPKDPEHVTRVRITGELHVHPERLPGIPRFLGEKMAPQVEKFVVDLITPNLTDLAKGLQSCLDDRGSERPFSSPAQASSRKPRRRSLPGPWPFDDWKGPVALVHAPYRNGCAEGWKGVPIHYSEYGAGEPTLVCCNGVGVSTFFWKHIVQYFATRHRVITWDYRGHRHSGLPASMDAGEFSMEANARDLVAVLDDCEVERAVALGHSMGCQVALELWRSARERVAGLVPICGAFGRPLDTAFGFPWAAQSSFDVFHAATQAFPRAVEAALRPLLRSRLPLLLARLGLINPQLADFADMRAYFEHLAEMNLQVFFQMAAEMQKHDAGPWLHRVDVPTLVVAGERDLFTPLSLSLEMHDRIPGAELLVLPKGSHAGLIEHPELLSLRLEKFLREQVEPFRAWRRPEA